MSYLKSFKLFVINLNFIKDIFNELTDTYTDIEVDYREKKITCMGGALVLKVEDVITLKSLS